MDYKSILKQYWGYDSFRGIQEDIINSIGSGRDTLGLMPTGGGKSITFQVPALAQPGLCLVVTPLIALMKDQVRNLRDRGIKSIAVYSGMTREEQSSSGSTTAMIFVLCFVFVYLLLSAQYESYILPFAVLLSIPFGLAGSFIFAHLMGLANNVLPILGAATNNIYMQIALIMLMGLLAKNAILIVEFALDRRKMGMSITWAAVLGAGARLRPILMTSLAMVVGLLPLMFAMGVGANGNRALGTAAVGGMFIGMICQIFVVPALFVIFQYLQEKVKPIEWEDIDNTDAETEIEQYAK